MRDDAENEYRSDRRGQPRIDQNGFDRSLGKWIALRDENHDSRAKQLWQIGEQMLVVWMEAVFSQILPPCIVEDVVERRDHRGGRNVPEQRNVGVVSLGMVEGCVGRDGDESPKDSRYEQSKEAERSGSG